MGVSKFYVIYDEISGGYWNRVHKELSTLEHATEYEGGTKENIEQIIMNDTDISNINGYYTVKTIIKINND